MKYLFFIGFISLIITSTTYAEISYTGIWKDQYDMFYSIHQSDDSVIIGELHNINTNEPISYTEQRNLFFTKNELDLSISGYGFFILEREDGTYTYTRKGKFKLSQNNEIINDRGDRLVTENMLSIPENINELNWNEYEIVVTEQTPECNDIFGCNPIEEKREEQNNIVILYDGSINLNNKQTGEIHKFDQIFLAWIPPGQMKKFSGYPINLKNNNSVSYFKPASKDHRYDANISQGALESLGEPISEIVWKGYYGNIIGKKSKLTRISNSKNMSSIGKEIHFENDSSATITNICNDVMCKYIDMNRYLLKEY